MSRFNYLRCPQAIYDASFQTIEAAHDWTGFPDGIRPIAKRMVHAVGRVDFLADLKWRGNPLAAGQAALAGGRKLLVDSRMVAAGIIDGVCEPSQLVCMLDEIPAQPIGVDETRSMAGMTACKDRLEGAVLVIGNAPTALFRLLEGLLDEAWPKPALVFGLPVGYIGAAEAKQAFLEHLPQDCALVTVAGRFGGSALAAACVNALKG